MSEFLTRNQVFAAKVQADQDTPSTPSTTADAIEVEQPSTGPQLETVQTNEVTGSVDVRPDLPAGARGTSTATALFKHSGTAETPPDLGVLLRGCAMAETITSAAVTGTAQAGGTTTSIVLASGASATTDAYVGMPINITAGTNNGYAGWITAYNGTTKAATVTPAAGSSFDNTSQYSIPKNVRYGPRSTGFEYLTLRQWGLRTLSGNVVLDEIQKAMGSWNLSVPVRQPGRLQFNFLGAPVPPADVSAPSSAVYDVTRPPVYLAASTLLNGLPVKPSSIEIAFGGEVSLSDDPAATYGYGPATQNSRKVTGTIELPRRLVANDDFFTAARAQTRMPFVASWGPSAGNRVAIVAPDAIFTNDAPADNAGFAHRQRSLGLLGSDRGVFLTFW